MWAPVPFYKEGYQGCTYGILPLRTSWICILIKTNSYQDAQLYLATVGHRESGCPSQNDPCDTIALKLTNSFC